jgi:aldehyde:ferredoxin oxidoreductase
VSYTGQILKIDLSSGEIKRISLDHSMQRKFLGSRGLAAKFLYDNAPPDADPYDSQNPLCFMTGPLTGTPAFGPNGYFTTISPLTNGYLDSGVKGHFPASLKFAGYDGFVITGRAKSPVFLYVDNESVEIKDAKNLWGKDCLETEQSIKEALNAHDLHIASIGPAGENRVRFACITSDTGRQAGRGGAGAVMGSKNLKAVAVRGTGSLKISDPETFLRLVKELHEYLKANAEPLRSYGTLWLVNAMNDYKMLPTRNFRMGQVEHPDHLNGEYASKNAGKRNMGCFSCSLLCSNKVTVVTGTGTRVSLDGPEYESLVLLGPNCGLEKFEEIVGLNVLCDRLGIDTMSAGGVLSFCMELYEHGILTKKDLGDVELTWGNPEAMALMLERIAAREGIGDILANGSRKAAEVFGKDSLKYAMQVKGMEMPAYDPRGATGMALAYAISDRGACHLRSWTIYEEVTGSLDQYGYEGKAALVAARHNRKLIIDSLGICEQAGLLPLFAGLYTAATAFPVKMIYNKTYKTLLEDFALDGEQAGVGARVYTLTRAFNVRRGFGRKDDMLPQRFFNEPLKTLQNDIPALDVASFDRMLDEYYEINGWGKDGVPTRQTLERFGLNEAIEDMC